MRRVVLLVSQSGMVARLLPAFRDAGFETVALATPNDPLRTSRHLGVFVTVPEDPAARA